jgi:hypothetical protein
MIELDIILYQYELEDMYLNQENLQEYHDLIKFYVLIIKNYFNK